MKIVMNLKLHITVLKSQLNYVLKQLAYKSGLTSTDSVHHICSKFSNLLHIFSHPLGY